MSKGLIALIVVAVLGLSIFMGYRSMYNNAVTYQEKVTKSWADVGADYQRRADLIPKLVAVVMKGVEKEGDIVTKVTQARAGLPSDTQINDLKNQIANADSPGKLQLLEKQLKSNEKSAQAFLNVAVEAYPNLKSIQGFQDLQAQLEGTENRIAFSRKDYNEAIMVYNSHIRGFFSSMFLNAAIFPHKDPFKEAAGSEKSPDVDSLLNK